METGVSGPLWVHVAKLAELEPKLEPDCATTLHRPVEDCPVQAVDQNPKLATHLAVLVRRKFKISY